MKIGAKIVLIGLSLAIVYAAGLVGYEIRGGQLDDSARTAKMEAVDVTCVYILKAMDATNPRDKTAALVALCDYAEYSEAAKAWVLQGWNVQPPDSIEANGI